MAKLTRITQKIFASLAGLDQVAEFGSFAQGTPTFTTDPSLVQTNTWLAGWFSAVLGDNSPCLEDFNSVFFLLSYQLAYAMQEGIPEWDSATTYYIGSLVNSSGVVYTSRTNTNLNNDPTADTTNWKKVAGDLMSALGDTTHGGASGAITKLAGNTTTTKKYLSQTGDGVNSAAPTWSALPTPTVQKFTSGSGTYTTPAGVRYIRVRALGGGGGGNGGNGASTVGTAGGDTTFGTTLISAGGGGVGSIARASGAGGASSLGSGPVGLALSGGSGTGGGDNTGGSGMPGGCGAPSALGGGGGGIFNNATTDPGLSSPANTGGGGGGGNAIVANIYSGGGGGAGGFVDAIIVAPAATYAYAVGAGGTGGAAGANGSAGGNGGSGLIVVEEFYQ